MLLFGQNPEVYKQKAEKRIAQHWRIFSIITPKNDKREAAENPLPHFSIMTINLVLPLTHTSNTPLPHTPWVLRVPVR